MYRYHPRKNAPTPVTTYAVFYNGEYVTNEQKLAGSMV